MRVRCPFSNSEVKLALSGRQPGRFWKADALGRRPLAALPANQPTMQVADPVVAEQPGHQPPGNMKRDAAALAADLEPFMSRCDRVVHRQMFSHRLINSPAVMPANITARTARQNA